MTRKRRAAPVRRASLALGAFVICALGLAFAQDDAAAPPPFVLEIASTPRPLGHYYPTQALERAVAGTAKLCCTAGEGNRLACRNPTQDRDRWDFFQAAAFIGSTAELTPASAASLRLQTHEVELTFTFDYTRGFMRNGIINVAASGQCEALTQTSAPAPRDFTPEWVSVPSAADYEGHYPPAALEAGVSGAAMLCCAPRADGSVDCAFGAELPRGQGLLDAGAGISESFRLTDASLADYRAGPPAWFPVFVPFRTGASSAEADQRIAALRPRAAEICAAGGTPPPLDGAAQ